MSHAGVTEGVVGKAVTGCLDLGGCSLSRTWSDEDSRVAGTKQRV